MKILYLSCRGFFITMISVLFLYQINELSDKWNLINNILFTLIMFVYVFYPYIEYFNDIKKKNWRKKNE